VRLATNELCAKWIERLAKARHDTQKAFDYYVEIESPAMEAAETVLVSAQRTR
jgi:hypothetical protein